MQCDLTGYRLTCGSDKALKSFNDGAFAIITLRDNGFPMIVKAAELDKSIVIAHCIIVSLYFNNVLKITIGIDLSFLMLCLFPRLCS
jgi:hypothetical protein